MAAQLASRPFVVLNDKSSIRNFEMRSLAGCPAV